METQLTGCGLKLYGIKNDVLVPVCGSRSGSLTINVEINEATKPIASYWQSNYYGKKSYTISASGMCILNPDKFTHTDIIKMIWNGTPMFWAMKSADNEQEFYAGTALINSFSLTADRNDMELYTLNATGDGELMINNPVVIKLLQAANGSVIQDGAGALIGWIETGGLPPMNDNC